MHGRMQRAGILPIDRLMWRGVVRIERVLEDEEKRDTDFLCNAVLRVVPVDSGTGIGDHDLRAAGGH